MAVPYKVPRGTRASLNSIQSGGGVTIGQIYLVTDESRLYVGLTASTVQGFVKQGETFSTTVSGLVPSPGSATGKVLSDNGTWIDAGDVVSSAQNTFTGSPQTISGANPSLILKGNTAGGLNTNRGSISFQGSDTAEYAFIGHATSNTGQFEIKSTVSSNNLFIGSLGLATIDAGFGGSVILSINGNAALIANTSGVTAGYILIAPAASTSAASIRLPHGTTPTSPVNGDLWTTTLGLYARINGVTVGPFGTGGGSSSYTVVNRSTTPVTETATSGEVIVLCTMTADQVINLPTAVSNTAKFVIKKTASGGKVTVDALGTQTIDGGLTAILTDQYETITLVSDNANWWIV